MATILTPSTLWKNFDDSLPLMDITVDTEIKDGICYERVKFFGRDCGGGDRVIISGTYAYDEENASAGSVLIIPDSSKTVDEDLLALFVRGGYCALMVDIRGKWEGVKDFTVYPQIIEYANYSLAGRRLDYVDETADKTTWYEWVAVGLYARKYLEQRSGSSRIGVVGIRDGGEVAWKLAYAGNFACAVPVCAAGWRAYKNYQKFGGGEPELNEERHRFIAAVDSQSYAPYVRCPVLMLCSTNDRAFDYDRAYDTFSRINADFIDESVITYSVKSNARIGLKSVRDMFMFLDKHVKDRQVFISKPAEIVVGLDEESNLTAKVVVDMSGEIENVGVYMAEDCLDPVIRDWKRARPKSNSEDNRQFFLDIYEKTNILFVICYVTYTNGFTVWSKITVKKLSGAFRNSCPASNVIYSTRDGDDCFFVSCSKNYAVADTFYVGEEFFPHIVECGGLRGAYSPCGLSTYRLLNGRFAPAPRCVISLDMYVAEECSVEILMTSPGGDEQYSAKISLVGDIWQNVLLDSKLFKNAAGKPLEDLSSGFVLTICCPVKYAVNNLIWL